VLFYVLVYFTTTSVQDYYKMDYTSSPPTRKGPSNPTVANDNPEQLIDDPEIFQPLLQDEQPSLPSIALDIPSQSQLDTKCNPCKYID
jgi:hypothetical protein